MNKSVTSKEEILKASRELIRTKGWSAVNIRNVAMMCNVSVGSIYNYFESKTELSGAAVESIWCEIFRRPDSEEIFEDIESCIAWIYDCMEKGCKKYPSFFTLHSLGFMEQDKQNGRLKMQETWQHIMDSLCIVLKNDSKIRSDAFNDDFTPEKFAELLFSLMLSALLRQDYDYSAVIKIIRRTLY